MIFQLLGAFLIVSLVIAVFEGEFAVYTRKQEQQDRKKRNLGLVAAFIMLDKDSGGSLDAVEFLAFVNGTCNTGRKFSVKRGLELTGPEFMEWVGELSHEFNAKPVLLPKDVVVSPYRRTEFRAINIPSAYKPGMTIKMPGGKEGQYDIYEYSVPPGTMAGAMNVACGGRSVEKIYPEDDVTFATITGRELAHWLAYNEKSAHFPYDPEAILITEADEDLDFVLYYRYLATDTCCTTQAAAMAMGEKQEARPGDEQHLDVRFRNLATQTGQGESKLNALSTSKKKRQSITAAKMNEIAQYDSNESDVRSMEDGNGDDANKEHDGSCNRCCLSLKNYLNGPAHRSLMFVLTMVNIAQLGMYGTGSETGVLESILDTISSIFLVWGFVEIGLRIVCIGWRDFWHVKNDFFQQSANRFDFKCNFITFCVLILCILIKAGNGEPIWFTRWNPARGYNDWSRIVLALPLMRAFSTIRLLRDIVMGMMTVIPLYVHVFTLLVIFFYFYGALGCLLFASDFKYNKDYILPDANFNSFLDSIMTLFQLFVGEAWNDVMEAALSTGKVVPSVLYFVSFIVVMTLLFTNLIIGIICSGYESINHVRKKHEEGEKISVSEVLKALKEGEAPARMLKLLYKESGEIVITRNKRSGSRRNT